MPRDLTYHIDPEYVYEGRIPAEARAALITPNAALDLALGTKAYWRRDHKRVCERVRAGDVSERTAVDRRFAASMWWVWHKKAWRERRKIGLTGAAE